MTLLKFKPATARDIFSDSMMPSHMMNMFEGMFNDSAAKFEKNVFFTPRADIAEKNNAFEVHMALPGMKKDEVKIAVEKDKMVISGERKFNNDEAAGKFLKVETYFGKFSRTFTLPENVDKTNISAELTDGILKIEIPKVEVKDDKTTIEVK